MPGAARKSVVSARLPDEWRSRWGELRRRGLGLPSQPLQAELFFRGARLPLARWPDNGFATTTGTPDGREGLRVTADRPLPAGIADEADLWAFGYWASAWAPWHVPVASIDGQRGIITLKPPSPRYGLREGRQFYLENALSALDRPGEWYLDRAAGRLFVWPLAELRSGDLELSLTETLLELVGASDVHIDGVSFRQPEVMPSLSLAERVIGSAIARFAISATWLYSLVASTAGSRTVRCTILATVA